MFGLRPEHRRAATVLLACDGDDEGVTWNAEELVAEADRVRWDLMIHAQLAAGSFGVSMESVQAELARATQIPHAILFGPPNGGFGVSIPTAPKVRFG